MRRKPLRIGETVVFVRDVYGIFLQGRTGQVSGDPIDLNGEKVVEVHVYDTPAGWHTHYIPVEALRVIDE